MIKNIKYTDFLYNNLANLQNKSLSEGAKQEKPSVSLVSISKNI